MKHARQKIRESVATIIGSVGTVYTSRVYPMIDLPVLSVYANTEQSQSENELINSPRRYTRQLTLQIDIAAEYIEGMIGITGVDDKLDDLAARVEALMAADVTLGNTCTDSALNATYIKLSGESDLPTGVAQLQYLVWYRTTGTDPENPIV